MLSAIPKFFVPDDMTVDWIFIVVALFGIVMNLMGAFFFMSYNIPHSHAHGNCSHDQGHGAHSHAHHHYKTTPSPSPVTQFELAGSVKVSKNYQLLPKANGGSPDIEEAAHCGHSHSHGHTHTHNHRSSHTAHAGHACINGQPRPRIVSSEIDNHEHVHHQDEHSKEHSNCQEVVLHDQAHNHAHQQTNKKAGDSNLWAIFCHSLMDAISSAFVALIGIIIYRFGKPGRDGLDYLDPAGSIAMSIFSGIAMWPILKHSCHILMERTPHHIDRLLLETLLRKVEGVCQVDSLYIIQLDKDDCFAAVQALCSLEMHSSALRDIKQIFKDVGISTSTVELYQAQKLTYHNSVLQT